MGWTYTGNNPLASTAAALARARAKPCRLAPFVLMSDPHRVPDICAAAAALPRGSAVIYRHFGARDKSRTAQVLRQIAFERDLQFLVGKDVSLAIQSGADGVHVPQSDLSGAAALRARFPGWIISAAAHDVAALSRAAEAGLDAALLSPVFASASPSAGTPLGVKRFSELARAAGLPVFALGGISAGAAPKLIGSGAAGLAGIAGFAAGAQRA